MNYRITLENTILENYTEIYSLNSEQKEDVRTAIQSLNEADLEDELSLIREYFSKIKYMYQRSIQQIIPKEEVDTSINFSYIF